MQEHWNGLFPHLLKNITLHAHQLLNPGIKHGKTIMAPKENHSEKEPLDDHGVHMPDRSWYPLVTALGYLDSFWYAFPPIR